MFMKRLVSLLLVLFITAGIVPASNGVFAAENDLMLKDAFEVLSHINVLQKLEADDAVLNKPVSRIEFATYAAALMGIDIYDTTKVSYYKDIPEDHWGKMAVNALTEQGIFSGGGESMFYPDEAVTMEQACKVLMTITGHDTVAQFKGGYPAGYLAVAKSYNVIPDVASYSSLTLRDVVLLIYNVVNMPYYEAVVYGDRYTEYSANEYKTYLSLYHNIYIAEGQLTSVGDVSLYANNTARDDEICIDGYAFKCDLDIVDSLGMKIKVYYEMGVKAEIGKVIYKCEAYDRNEVLVISSENIQSFDEVTGTLTYYEDANNNRIRREHISKKAFVVYNGRAAAKNLKRALSVTNGKVKLIKTKGEDFDVVIAEQYNNINIAQIDATQKVIYDAYDNKLSLDLKEEPGEKYVKILNPLGMTQEFATLKQGDVVQYIESDDKTYIRAYICTNTVSGKVTGFSQKGGEYIVKVDGTGYTVSKVFADKAKLFPYSAYINSSEKKIEVGDDTTFVLDLNGKIAGATFSKTEEMKCGFLVDAVDKSEFEEQVAFKIFTQDGKMSVYRSVGKVIVDGNSLKTANSVLNAIRTEDGVYYQAIRYRLDANESIKEIDTVKRGEKENDYSLTHTNKGEPKLYYSWLGLLGPKNYVSSSNTIVIQVPEKSNILTAEDDEFKISGRSVFKDREASTVDIYKFNPDVLTSDLVIAYKAFTPNIGYSNGIMLVDEVLRTINAEGDVVDCISGLHNGELKSVYVAENYDATEYEDSIGVSQIDSGDVIVFASNAVGEAIRIRMICDYSIAEKNEPNNLFFANGAMNPNFAKTRDDYYSDFTDRYRISYGYVNRVSGNVLTWSYNELGKDDEIYDVTFADNLAKIMVYDTNKKTEKVFKGTIKDIIPYENSYNSYTKILTMAQNGQIYAIVFYI